MVEVQLCCPKLLATVGALVPIVLVDIPTSELDLAPRQSIEAAESDDLGHRNPERRCLDETTWVLSHGRRQLLPVIEAVGDEVLVQDLSTAGVQQSHSTLPAHDVDCVETAVEDKGVRHVHFSFQDGADSGA